MSCILPTFLDKKMKCFIKIIVLVFVFSNLVLSQTPRLIGPPGGSVFYNQFVIHPQNTNIIVTTTWSAAVFRSSDGGNSIVPIETNLGSRQISSIALPFDKENEIFLGVSGYYLFSSDVENSWQIISKGPYIPDVVINPKNSNAVFIKNDNKTLWRSYDKGFSWTQIRTFEQLLNRIAISPADTSIIYAASDFSLFKSTDSGDNWFKVYAPPDTNYFGVDQIEVNPVNSNLLFIKAGGNLYKSLDGGISFSKTTIYDMSFFAVNPIDPNIIYVTIGDPFFAPISDIRKTTDGGSTWFSIRNDIPAEYVTANSIKINPQKPDEIYVDLSGLGIFISTNGGSNWKRSNLCFSDVGDIYLNPDSTGHILSAQAGWGVMKTIDGGENWNHPLFEGWIGSLLGYKLIFNPIIHNKGFLKSQGDLYKTTDYGNVWYKSGFPQNIKYISYHTFLPEELFTSGDEGTFYSVDDGMNWEKVSDAKSLGNFVFHPDSANVIYTYIFDAIRKSTDGGKNWSVKHSGLRDTKINFITSFALDVNDPSTLYCGQGPSLESKGSLSMSTNGGDNWTQISSSLTQLDPFVNISSILLDEKVKGRIYVGMSHGGTIFTSNFSNGGLFLTEDNGKTWRKVFNSSVNLIRADNSVPRNIYIGTKFGIMKFLDTLTVTSIPEELLPPPSDFRLFQNYPNPFNPSTTINYQLPTNSFVTLKVFDILGNDVAVLVNEWKEAGSYSAQFTTSGKQLASGMYFYTLTAGKFTDTKKFILLK